MKEIVGFRTIPTEKPPTSYKCSVVHPKEICDNEELIKRSLIDEISKQIVESKNFFYTKEPYQNPYLYKFTAKVIIVESSSPKMILENRFMIGNVSFTEEEIEKALRKTYPYKLI